MSELPDDTQSTVGRAMEHAVVAITRWATRPEVRRSLLAEGSEAFSATDTWLLQHLVEEGAVRMSRLAEWQGVDRSTITTQINGLEARGLVARQTDPNDGRAVLVTATAGARALVLENSLAARALLDQLVASWSTRERAEFARLLDRFTTEIESSPPRPEVGRRP